MGSSIEQQIQTLTPLVDRLKAASTVVDKLGILNELPIVNAELKEMPHLSAMIESLNPSCAFALKSLLSLGQGPLVFQGFDKLENPSRALASLLETLLDVERLYEPIGGIVGYHLAILKLLRIPTPPPHQEKIRYLRPAGHPFDILTPAVRQAIRWGIETLPWIAEIYPVGGAGDRLSLADAEGRPLPAAELRFEGRTLLEGLIRDLQAREYLYFKLTGKKIVTPIVLMTSHEKENHAHVVAICESRGWFGRPRESFFLFTQPLVPVLTKTGEWSLAAPLKLHLKPGGHGVLWKLAQESGALKFLSAAGRFKVLVRQINNPIAGIDYGLLAFTGIGCHEDKIFGFASCERLLKMPEGMNVLIERQGESGYDYTLTNVEYTDFAHKGLQDAPEEPGGAYSMYPSNTNILFADLKAIQKAVEINPFPGMLINMKTQTQHLTREGGWFRRRPAA